MPEAKNQAPNGEKDTQSSPDSRYPIVKKAANLSRLLAPTFTFILTAAISINAFFGAIDSWNSKFYNAVTGKVIRIGGFFAVVMFAGLSIVSIIGILVLLYLWSQRHIDCYQLNCPACGQPLLFPIEQKAYDCPTCTKRLVMVGGTIKAAGDLISTAVTIESEKEMEE